MLQPPYANDFSCDPCIDRPTYTVQAIVHGTESDEFWQQVRAAAVQTGRDMRIELRFDLYEEFDSDRMAKDILETAFGDDPPGALVVTIPSPAVEKAVSAVVDSGIPVFGLNSGYKVAVSLGVLGFVAMDEYAGGAEAARQFLTKKKIARALYVNTEKGNSALDTRFRGFRESLQEESDDEVEIDELIVVPDPFSDLSVAASKFQEALNGCTYDAVLLSGSIVLEHATSAMYANGCTLSDHLLGTFDTRSEVYDAIAVGKLSFAVWQQQHLQGVLSVLMAALFVTTGKKLLRSADSRHFGTYLSGPSIVTLQNLPSDTLQVCEADAFPVCSNTLVPDGMMESKCTCTDRSLIRIGGVLHGTTTDASWDTISQARQAADDLGIELKLDRFEPEETTNTLYGKMAKKVVSLCQEGVDGVFVSIPSNSLVPAIEQCRALNVPVMSIGSGRKASMDLDFVHHIGQDEYNAGLGAGFRLVRAGMTKGYCLNHEPGNVAFADRCTGLEKAIALSPGVEYGGMVYVPADNSALYKTDIESAVGESGDWAGIGALLCGQTQVESALNVQNSHPEMIIGVFDATSRVYGAIDDGRVLFAVDQVSFLQGYMPIWLLTLHASSKQSLANTFIATGPNYIETSPSDPLQVCEANHFEVCPEPVKNDLNQLTQVRPVGLALAAIILVTSVVFAIWVLWNCNQRVVRKSQPFFLIMICAGTFVMGVAIVPLGIDDSVASDDVCSKACMAVPWLFTLGFTIAFSALFSKIWRIERLIRNSNSFKRVQVTMIDVMLPFAILLVLNLVFMLVWTLVDPMYWERNILCGSGDLSSYGTCVVGQSPVSVAMLSCVIVINICAVIIANIAAYRARRISTEFSESKYVGMVMVCFLQIAIVGVPLIVLVSTDPPASYFVRAAIIFVLCMSMLLLIIVPKVHYVRQDKKKKAEKESRERQEFQSMNYSFASSTRNFLQTTRGLKVYDYREPPEAVVPKKKIRELERLLAHQGLGTDLEPLFKKANIAVEGAEDPSCGHSCKRANAYARFNVPSILDAMDLHNQPRNVKPRSKSLPPGACRSSLSKHL